MSRKYKVVEERYDWPRGWYLYTKCRWWPFWRCIGIGFESVEDARRKAMEYSEKFYHEPIVLYLDIQQERQNMNSN